MKEYDIFVPLYYNDGSPVETEKFQKLQEALVDRFEGLTFFPQPNKGFWKMAGVTYRDEIVVYRVITSTERARLFLEEFKEELKSAFGQEEILIVELFWFSVKWSWRGLVLVSDRLKKEHGLLISGRPVFASLGFFALVLKASTGQAGRRDWATAPLASNP